MDMEFENAYQTLEEITRVVGEREACFHKALRENSTYDYLDTKKLWVGCLYEARQQVGRATNTIEKYHRNYLGGEIFVLIYDGQTRYAYNLFKSKLRKKG